MAAGRSYPLNWGSELVRRAWNLTVGLKSHLPDDTPLMKWRSSTVELDSISVSNPSPGSVTYIIVLFPIPGSPIHQNVPTDSLYLHS
jgi:hypothetical protein